MSEIFGEAWPAWPAEDFALIAQPIDWLGVNYYTRNVTRHDEAKWPLKAGRVRQEQRDLHRDRLGGVSRKGLTDTLKWVKAALRRHPDPDHRERGRLLSIRRRSTEGRSRILCARTICGRT